VKIHMRASRSDFIIGTIRTWPWDDKGRCTDDTVKVIVSLDRRSRKTVGLMSTSCRPGYMYVPHREVSRAGCVREANDHLDMGRDGDEAADMDGSTTSIAAAARGIMS